MEPGIHHIPSHRHGTSWGYSWDFREYGAGYLTGASARFVVVDAAGNVVMDLSTENGLTIGDLVENAGIEEETTTEDVMLNTARSVIALPAGEYEHELRLELASGEVVPVAEGRWPISPSKIPGPVSP